MGAGHEPLGGKELISGKCHELQGESNGMKV